MDAEVRSEPLREHRLSRSVAVAVGVGLAAYAVLQWVALRPAAIAEWRESDTQTIARHFTEPGANIFYPRIDWGGAGKGFVETEFQLYTWIVSVLMRIADPSAEWPGRVVSLAAVCAAGYAAYVLLARRFGELAAVCGVGALLTTRSVVQTATAVQPEALCLLLFVVAWFQLVEYTRTGHTRALVVYAVAGGLAMLVKPTAAQLGVASLVLLAIRSPATLRRPPIWIAWGAMVAVLVVYMLHARSVYLEYGNTFGVLSGGESKVPRPGLLVDPELLARTAKRVVLWGIGPLGVVACLALAYLHRATPRQLAPVLALLVGIVVWAVAAMRYTSFDGGNHYHVLSAVVAAEAVAGVVAAAGTSWPRGRVWLAVAAVVAVGAAGQFADSAHHRRISRTNSFSAAEIALAGAAEPFVAPGELVVVRSSRPAYDEFWQDEIQYADPRVFYLTGTRGWSAALDDDDPAHLDEWLAEGARFYFEPVPAELPRTDAWLTEHAALVAESEYGGRVFALDTDPPSVADP